MVKALKLKVSQEKKLTKYIFHFVIQQQKNDNVMFFLDRLFFIDEQYKD